MKRDPNHRLSPVEVRAATKPGRYCDGAGLYLFVQTDGRRSWVFRYRDRITGKLRDKGLGPAWDVSLAEARVAAKACRAQLRAGVDPIDSQREQRAAEKLARLKRKTFAECVTAYIAGHRAGWRNEKHAAQWQSTLDTYAATLLPLAVEEIDTALVIGCLEPTWAAKTETMTRVRQRIEAVLDWATARGYRSGENPARWRGHLDKLLPKPTKLKAVEHRPAVPYVEVPAFLVELRQRPGLSCRALELQILTATRPGEVVGAEWREIDLDAAFWTIPASRMKAAKEHRVALSTDAVLLLRAIPRVGDHVFPGRRQGQAMGTAALLKVLQEMRPGTTVHGFRSSFRDWAGEVSAFPREVIEHALAHRLKDKAEAAYQRGDLFTKRQRLMEAWARYCGKPASGEAVAIRRGQKA